MSLSTSVKYSTVKILGTKLTGEEISCDITVTHPASFSAPEILGAALNIYKQIGGIVHTTDDHLDFYPGVQLLPPIRLEIKNIQLASVMEMPSPSLQVVS